MKEFFPFMDLVFLYKLIFFVFISRLQLECKLSYFYLLDEKDFLDSEEI